MENNTNEIHTDTFNDTPRKDRSKLLTIIIGVICLVSLVFGIFGTLTALQSAEQVKTLTEDVELLQERQDIMTEQWNLQIEVNKAVEGFQSSQMEINDIFANILDTLTFF